MMSFNIQFSSRTKFILLFYYAFSVNSVFATKFTAKGYLNERKDHLQQDASDPSASYGEWPLRQRTTKHAQHPEKTAVSNGDKGNTHSNTNTDGDRFVTYDNFLAAGFGGGGSGSGGSGGGDNGERIIISSSKVPEFRQGYYDPRVTRAPANVRDSTKDGYNDSRGEKVVPLQESAYHDSRESVVRAGHQKNERIAKVAETVIERSRKTKISSLVESILKTERHSQRRVHTIRNFLQTNVLDDDELVEFVRAFFEKRAIEAISTLELLQVLHSVYDVRGKNPIRDMLHCGLEKLKQGDQDHLHLVFEKLEANAKEANNHSRNIIDLDHDSREISDKSDKKSSTTKLWPLRRNFDRYNDENRVATTTTQKTIQDNRGNLVHKYEGGSNSDGSASAAVSATASVDRFQRHSESTTSSSSGMDQNLQGLRENDTSSSESTSTVTGAIANRLMYLCTFSLAGQWGENKENSTTSNAGQKDPPPPPPPPATAGSSNTQLSETTTTATTAAAAAKNDRWIKNKKSCPTTSRKSPITSAFARSPKEEIALLLSGEDTSVSNTAATTEKKDCKTLMAEQHAKGLDLLGRPKVPIADWYKEGTSMCDMWHQRQNQLRELEAMKTSHGRQTYEPMPNPLGDRVAYLEWVQRDLAKLDAEGRTYEQRVAAICRRRTLFVHGFITNIIIFVAFFVAPPFFFESVIA